MVLIFLLGLSVLLVGKLRLTDRLSLSGKRARWYGLTLMLTAYPASLLFGCVPQSIASDRILRQVFDYTFVTGYIVLIALPFKAPSPAATLSGKPEEALSIRKRGLRLLKEVLIIVLVIVLLVVAGWGALLAFSAANGYPGPSHRISRYSAFRTEFGKWGRIEHFPTRIPDSATLKRFTYQSAFLQAGSWIQLRLRLPEEEINALYDRFKHERSLVVQDESKATREDGPMTGFVTGESSGRDFPEDYEILPLQQLESRAEGRRWGTSSSYGVAISKRRNEIVYWAESLH